MKKTKIKVLFPLAALLLALCSCNPGGGDDSSTNDDPTKINIHVGNLDTGYGTKWLENAASRYEELHKDDVYGDKTGVKITINPTSDSEYPRDGSQILSDNIDVHFRENVNIDTLIKSDALMDLTEVLSNANDYDNGTTIISKISEDDKKLYSDDNKIYAAPLYSGSYGLIYNKTLFKSKKLYIDSSTPANTTDISKVVFTGTDRKKSNGYDGIKGTYDDGLPCTYTEFEAILNALAGSTGYIPLGWSSRYREDYVTKFLASAFSSDVGYEEAVLRYSFDGEAKSLGRIVEIAESKQFVKDSASTLITNGKDGNGYEMMRSKGVYDALYLYEIIAHYLNLEPKDFIGKSGNIDHYTMQDYMVEGYINKDGDFKQVAMTIDGTWFYNELLKHKDESEIVSDYGFMPIPKSTFQGVDDRKYVFTEEAQSCVFVKKNISDEYRKQVALDFVKFFYSDNELINFTKTTKCVIGVKYPEITGEDYDELGSFGQDVYNMTKNSYRINTNYPNELLLKNKNVLINQNFFKTQDDPNPIDAIAGGTSAADYFNKIVNYFNSEKWSDLS